MQFDVAIGCMYLGKKSGKVSVILTILLENSVFRPGHTFWWNWTYILVISHKMFVFQVWFFNFIIKLHVNYITGNFSRRNVLVSKIGGLYRVLILREIHVIYLLLIFLPL